MSDGTISTRSIPRRGFLLGTTVVAAGAIGAGVTYAVDDNGGRSGVPGAATPGEQLMAEHGVLKRTLLVYRALSNLASEGRPLPTSVIHGAATVIHDYIEGFHEALEEAYVFPTLERARVQTATVNTLLVQHAAGRRITQSLLTLGSHRSLDAAQKQAAVARIDAFVRMYEPHEAREDTVIFPAYRSVTGDHELSGLGERFAALQVQQFGPTGFDDVVATVADLEAKLGIEDLAQFTPTIT